MQKLGPSFEETSLKISCVDVRAQHEFVRNTRLSIRFGRIKAQDAIDLTDDVQNRLKALRNAKDHAEYENAIKLGRSDLPMAEVDFKIDKHSGLTTVHFDRAITALNELANDLGALAFPSVRQRANLRF